MSKPAAEIVLDTSQGAIAGLAWEQPGWQTEAPRVIYLHGWLDNAASFIPLASLMPALNGVALDLPGHGYSDHRHASTRYHFIDYLFNLDAALDSLGWTDCHIVGHSMGAAIASCYAAGAPERVRSLVLLDSIGPITVSAETTAERLKRSLHKQRRGSRSPRHFDSIEKMAEARMKVSGFSAESARLICQRAAVEVDGKYTWRSDPALNWVSALVMTEDQALNLLENIQAPTLTMIANEDTPWVSETQHKHRRQALANAQFQSIEGHHHFHMDAADEIAETVQSFIRKNDHEPNPIAD